MSQSIVDRSSLMTGTKFGQGTRGIIKIHNGDFIGDTDTADFLQNRQNVFDMLFMKIINI
jgi:hypothetical protein